MPIITHPAHTGKGEFTISVDKMARVRYDIGERKTIMNNQRKAYRLPGYDYSRPGTYFVTLCVKDKSNLFWDKTALLEKRILLTQTAKTAEVAVEKIPEMYPNTAVDLYTIMPDHIHLLLVLRPSQEMNPPDLGRIIGQLKGYITKQLGFSPWQKLFYERIIKDENDYWQTRQYIISNPAKWLERHDN